MYIVDYSIDYYQRDIETKTFDDDDKSYIVDFIADKSVSKNFRIVRINKYENGKLYPYIVKLNHGRITIEAEALEESE